MMIVLMILAALFSLVAVCLAVLSLSQMDRLEQELDQLKVRLVTLELAQHVVLFPPRSRRSS
jgi:sensor domain CHASE-containing protein